MTSLISTLKHGIIAVAVIVVFIYFVPMFHIVSLSEKQQKVAADNFNASDYASSFWQGPLLDASNNAVDIAELLASFQLDKTSTADKYGHRLGLSSSAYYFVGGQGHVVTFENNIVAIAIKENGDPVVVIEIGPVFGNAVRDGSGLLDINTFANAQDFNAVSSEINHLVEKNVLPLLKEKVTVGTSLRFVGAVEVNDYEDSPSSLNLIPVVIEIL